MFNGGIAWRGIVYSILTLVGKLVCGLWLVRVSLPASFTGVFKVLARMVKQIYFPLLWCQQSSQVTAPALNTSQSIQEARTGTDPAQQTLDLSTTATQRTNEIDRTSERNSRFPNSADAAPISKPTSLYPAAMLGFAMVARGEIGFLISSLAASNGILSADGDDELFLITTWAIVLCTIIGPVGLGLLVRRVRRLEDKKEHAGGGRDVLGVWAAG